MRAALAGAREQLGDVGTAGALAPLPKGPYLLGVLVAAQQEHHRWGAGGGAGMRASAGASPKARPRHRAQSPPCRNARGRLSLLLARNVAAVAARAHALAGQLRRSEAGLRAQVEGYERDPSDGAVKGDNPVKVSRGGWWGPLWGQPASGDACWS
jgi:hypothetical protein